MVVVPKIVLPTTPNVALQRIIDFMADFMSIPDINDQIVFIPAVVNLRTQLVVVIVAASWQEVLFSQGFCN
jgi:hypothetical protein